MKSPVFAAKRWLSVGSGGGRPAIGRFTIGVPGSRSLYSAGCQGASFPPVNVEGILQQMSCGGQSHTRLEGGCRAGKPFLVHSGNSNTDYSFRNNLVNQLDKHQRRATLLEPDLGTPIYLKCRECGKEYPPQKLTICDDCFGPLDVEYDIAKIDLDRRSFEGRSRNIWRYHELLPIVDKRNIVDLHTGFTPLAQAENLGRSIGTKRLYVKNDSVNPTFSFKDRPAEVAVSKALEFGDSVVCAVSTGNLGASVAAHAAKARLASYILTPNDIETAKIAQILAYGAEVISVDGTYDEANRVAILASDELGWNVVNVTSRPYYVEGSKTIAFEICEQFGWVPPDNLIIPVASGALLRAIYVGFEQFLQLGLVGRVPKIFGAQAEGCSPIAQAFRDGSTEVKPVESPATIAKSIAIGDPGDGKYVLQVAKNTRGGVESASDPEIIQGILELAKLEGIFTEPAGAVTVAVARKLVNDGKIPRDESIVCCVTGNGLKTNELVLENRSISKPRVIKPSLEALREALPLEVGAVHA